ncbi:MAG: protein kinase [Pseudomonadota bacterium]|nr:protein kinase [Pseudomonadota bacterium]
MSVVTLGPLQLVAPIAQGGMGEVWRGVHARQGVPVAIKFLREDDARFRAAFFAEVRAVARLDHPAVILVLDHGVVDAAAAAASGGRLRENTPWLAMEYCSGGTLKHAVARNWNQLRRLLLDLLAALAHAHARGVLHRDIKPDNVIFSSFDDSRPGVKLTDFGLAFALEVEGRDRTVVTGTPAYMAPEQFRREWRDYGPWTDLYALGCLAWRLAAGDPPYGQKRPPEVLSMAHQELPLPAFKPRFEVPPGFVEWLARLLEKDPARRIQRAADAAVALLTLDGSREPGGILPADWRTTEAPRMPMRLVGAGLGLWSLRGVPMVGREAERDRLWDALQEVHRTWSARLVLLHGPAGTGTTRLAEWLCERAHEVGGAEVFVAEHPVPAHAAAADPATALPAMLARHLVTGGLAPEDVRARVEARLRAQGVTDGAEAKELAELIAPTSADPDDTLGLDGPAERHALVRRAVARATGARPVIVRLEDVQWGSDALAFAAHVLRAQETDPSPILLVLTARAEALAERPVEALQLSELMGLGAVATWLEVGPLGENEQVALVEGLLGLGGALGDQVRARSGGNPAFAVQLVGDWVARGILEAGEDGFSLRPGARAELPDDLHATWAARLDRALASLGPRAPAAHAALEIAAALGPEVDEGEWRRACAAADLAIPSGLVERLVLERLVAPVVGDAGDEDDQEELVWAFSHGMLRESIARGAVEAGRAPAAHRACAAMLLDRHGTTALAERLGRHLLAAGAFDDALGFLMQAARERSTRGEFRAGFSLLAAREEALRGLGAPPSDPRWGEGRLLHAWLHLRQGQTVMAAQRAEGILAETRRHAWSALLPDALHLSGEVARARGAPSKALELIQQARTLFERLGNERGAAGCGFALGALALQLGELPRAARLLQQAQVALLRAGDERRLADCVRLRAETARRGGALDVAEGLIHEAQALYAKLQNKVGQAETLFVRAEIARNRGDLEDAVAGYRTALRTLETAGSDDVGMPLVRLGMVLTVLGRPADALTVLDAARLLAERHEDPRLSGVALAARVAVDAALGDGAAFDSHLARAVALLEGTDLVDPDVAEVMERAARSVGDARRADAALALAEAQWGALGRADRVGNVRKWRARLG